MEPEKTRINKYLSEIGYCSRRKADQLLEAKQITVNGKYPEPGTKVLDSDEVRVFGKLVKRPEKEFIYIALNKPVGIVCTTDTKREKNNIVDFINYPERIFPIGRLDKPSEGLIFMTNDGDIVNKILRSVNDHEKEYLVTVDKPVTKGFLHKMRNGVPILDTVTKKCEVEKTGKFSFRIVLTQGLNRQIRRMCEFLGYNVVSLKRIRIMNVKLDVPTGQWRYLTKHEISEIKKQITSSSKTSEY